ELVKGKTVAIDATRLEANAAMRSIVRRDNGASYEEFLKALAKGQGIGNPDADAGRSGAIGPQAEEEGRQQGLGQPA
ncbi:MAG TPA: hypothetical protein VK604_04880, partial [Bryobacteraceae bacterium]|nr:hypothetical protein [Bryobacteraceae bacterium]